MTRNDLADPFLFGLSSGAAAGAVSVITVFGDNFGIWTLPVAAFTGGILAASIASCALFGAVLLLASDLLARTLLPPQELPIGIITTSLGAFFVVTMVVRNRL